MMVTALATRPGRQPAARPDLSSLRVDLQQETGALRGELLEAEARLHAEMQMEVQTVRHDLSATGRQLERAVDRMVWKLTGLMTAEAVVVYALVRLLF